jgi:hypothetical protein
MRRWKLIVVLLALAVAIAVGAFVLWPREDRITPENYRLISRGMSRSQVHAILGPPRDLVYGRPAVTELPTEGIPGESVTCEHWRATTWEISIFLDRDGKVKYANCGRDFTPLNPLERLWMRLRAPRPE